MKKNIIYSILASTLLFSACSTDLDVVGDYKETLVVYGLLDQAADTQFVKINKAFLGEGNAFSYAEIKDSTQFINALNVKIKCIASGIQYSLTPINTIPKEDGIFYGPDQTNVIYMMLTNGTAGHPHLNPNSEYDLTVNNSETGSEITAKTIIVPDISGYTKPIGTVSAFSFVITGPYPNFSFPVEWASAKNARLYEEIIRLHYTDSTTSGNIVRQIDYKFPDQQTMDLFGGQTMGNNISGTTFYRYIANTLSDYPGLIHRVAGNADILLISGADDLNTFIDVNKPSTGIIQERPEFTNINGGLGLFSSRYIKAPFSRPLSGISVDSLACGQYTKHLKFLNALGQVNTVTGEPITCP